MAVKRGLTSGAFIACQATVFLCGLVLILLRLLQGVRDAIDVVSLVVFCLMAASGGSAAVLAAVQRQRTGTNENGPEDPSPR